MAATRMGWPGLPDGDPRLKTGTIPGTSRTLTARDIVLPLLLHFCAAWNAEMPARLKLSTGPVDGWEYREQRSGGALSMHGIGGAVDLRYDVLLADQKHHMTAAETQILTRILARYATADGHHVLANGYTWGACDEMHTELSQSWEPGAKRDTTPGDVVEVIARLGIRPDGTSGTPAPTPGTTVPEEDTMILHALYGTTNSFWLVSGGKMVNVSSADAANFTGPKGTISNEEVWKRCAKAWQQVS